MHTLLWLERVTCRDAAMQIISFLMPTDAKFHDKPPHIRRGPECDESSFWHAIARAGFVELITQPDAARHFRDIAWGATIGNHAEIIRFVMAKKTWLNPTKAQRMTAGAILVRRVDILNIIIAAHYVPEMKRIRTIRNKKNRSRRTNEITDDLHISMILFNKSNPKNQEILAAVKTFARKYLPRHQEFEQEFE